MTDSTHPIVAAFGRQVTWCEQLKAPHTAALLALSDAILQNAGDVDDATVQAARSAGVTDAEIGEVVGHIALNVLTNYFNVLSEVDIDWPVVTPGTLAA